MKRHSVCDVQMMRGRRCETEKKVTVVIFILEVMRTSGNISKQNQSLQEAGPQCTHSLWKFLLYYLIEGLQLKSWSQ